jgi:hypothetical protein
MSKRMKQVILSVLISMAVLAGVYTTVLGASSKRGEVSVNASAVFGSSSQRHAAQKLEVYMPQTLRSGHDCGSEEGMNPNDY